MDVRRGPRSDTPSPRYLAYRHAKRRLRVLDPAAKSSSTPEIGPGEEQLYSFYVPGLQAGFHTIDVVQNIEAANQKKEVKNSHDFNVIGPRFSLPEGCLNSFYPPQGHGDRAEVLPSVVFTDPTFPWERSSSTNRLPDFSRARVPWLAVLVFTQDELRLSAAELTAVFGERGGKQGDTLSSVMLASDVQNLKNTNTKSIIYDEATDGKDTKANIIFLRPELFNSLFAKYDANGTRVPNKTGDEEHCYVLHHRFLAHLRHIHLDDTPVAGTTESPDHAYSVIVGHRTGPLSIDKPTPVVAHLVNIEAVEGMSTTINEKFVAMSSLHSWEYNCLPPSSLDVEASFKHIGDGLNVLRPMVPKADKDELDSKGNVGKALNQRLEDGFSLLRYRTQTGEVTAGFYRSPFTPTTVKFPEETHWPPGSTTGTKLQILDPNLNIMDITYSTAWNLGKSLGLAHPEFSVSLSRVRKQIYDLGMEYAKTSVIAKRSEELGVSSPYKSKTQVLSTLSHSLREVSLLAESPSLPMKTNGMVHRWHRPEHPPLDLSYQGPEINAIIDEKFEAAAKKIAGSVEDPKIPYNEHNTPYSTDWMIVLRWILDRYHLADVPAHYLITDPSHLPEESLRFFNIDPNWVAAMIDGGLSLANHLDQTDDRVRNAMKYAVQWYLTTPLPKLNYHPTIPSYGFYLRSALVTKFPDMIVDLEPRPSDTFPPVILHHEVADQGTMLCLMREPPAQPEFKSLFLREPPHQQYFAAAAKIDPDEITVEYKRIYTVKEASDSQQREAIKYTSNRKSLQEGRSIFIWGDANEIRVLNIENLVADYQRTLTATFKEVGHPEWYTDTVPNAAMLGLQLTEPEWQLQVTLPSKEVFPDLFKADSNISRLLKVPKRSVNSLSTQHNQLVSTVASSPHAEFGNRHRHTPMKLKHAPPHFRVPLPDHTINPIFPSLLAAPNDLAHAPKFIYNVYPVGQKPGDPIPMTGKPQDLVFSIVYESGAQNFLMESLEIRIKLNPPGHLFRQYTGPGPTMLSNLRFNALARLSPEREFLVLTLKPRTTKGNVAVKKLKELSFLLSTVVVSTFDAETVVIVHAYEQYKDQAAYSYEVPCVLTPAVKKET